MRPDEILQLPRPVRYLSLRRRLICCVAEDNELVLTKEILEIGIFTRSR